MGTMTSMKAMLSQYMGAAFYSPVPMPPMPSLYGPQLPMPSSHGLHSPMPSSHGPSQTTEDAESNDS